MAKYPPPPPQTKAQVRAIVPVYDAAPDSMPPNTRQSAYDLPAVSIADLDQVQVNFARIVGEQDRKIRELEAKLKSAAALADSRVTMAPPSSATGSTRRQVAKIVLVLLGTAGGGASVVKVADKVDEATSPDPVDARVVQMVNAEKTRIEALEAERVTLRNAVEDRRKMNEKLQKRVTELEDEHDDVRRTLERRGFLPRKTTGLP